MFRKKVHLESSTVAQKSAKHHKNMKKKKILNDWGYNKNDLVHLEEEDSSANREYWIKTDADCKHATTFHNSYIYAFQFNYRIWWFTWWKYHMTITEKIIYSMSIFSFSSVYCFFFPDSFFLNVHCRLSFRVVKDCEENVVFIRCLFLLVLTNVVFVPWKLICKKRIIEVLICK